MGAETTETVDVCHLAKRAAENVIIEKCGGKVILVGEYGRVYVPPDVVKQLCGNPRPLTERDRQKAIESCIGGDWARAWVKAVLGPDAPSNVAESVGRRLCESLIR